MRTKMTFGALLVAVVAMLSLASFSNRLGTADDGSPSIATAYTVFNGCVDERMSSIALDYKNKTTGVVGRQVIMASSDA